ncbi:hypothetical protein DIPPA_12484 [Diplonema papillatum]|nr:hypothetical protein DIPPA_12484 [Diplonema papillatum]
MLKGGKLKLKGDKPRKADASAKNRPDSDRKKAALKEIAAVETDPSLPAAEKAAKLAELRMQIGAEVELSRWEEAQSFRSKPEKEAAKARLEALIADDGGSGLTADDAKGNKRVLKKLQTSKEVDPISVYGDLGTGRKRRRDGTEATATEALLDRRCKLKHDRYA